MAEYFQKWHNRTSSRTRSTKTSNGLAAVQAQLNNLEREIKKVNEKVYAAQDNTEQQDKDSTNAKTEILCTLLEEKLWKNHWPNSWPNQLRDTEITRTSSKKSELLPMQQYEIKEHRFLGTTNQTNEYKERVHAGNFDHKPVFVGKFSIITGFTIIDGDDITKDVALGMKFCKKYASCQMIMKKFALGDNCGRIMDDE
ncbi:hypothetical protein Tco_0024148 [Tanacetum coccineum]